MNRNLIRKVVYGTMVLCFIAGLVGCVKTEVRPMAIQFPNSTSIYTTNGKYAQKTITAWIRIDGAASSNNQIANDGTRWWFDYDSVNHRIGLQTDFDDGSAVWYISTTLTVGNTYFVALTYDNSAAANDPIFYVAGLPIALAYDGNRTGAILAEGNNLFIGGKATTANFSNITIFDWRQYNRILFASEILEIYNVRGADNIANGLVRHPILIGAAGVSDYSGSLAGPKVPVDDITGVSWVLQGSPTAIADTLLTWGQ